MNQSVYLSQPEVKGFVEFMVKVLNGSHQLNFPYSFHPNHAPSCFNGKFGLVGTAATLEDLFNRYWWDRQYYIHNSTVLQCLQKSLGISISGNHPVTSNIIKAVKGVMDWGVTPRAAAHNMAWAARQGNGLAKALIAGQAQLNSDSPNFSVFQVIRMNAGYTKVFSLICENIIIYDGRVGAALGWLVRQFLVSAKPNHFGPVPESLAFLWGSGRGGHLRNPSVGELNFLRLANNSHGSQAWARVNVHASWILQDALSKSSSSWCSDPYGLRKIEAALFMLGYKLP